MAGFVFLARTSIIFESGIVINTWVRYYEGMEQTLKNHRKANAEVPQHLSTQATLPLAIWADQTKNIGHQGDVWFKAWDGEIPCNADRAPLGGAGHKVVEGEADRNSHTLNGDGYFVRCSPVSRRLDYGLLAVPENGEAVLTHTAEHEAICFGPGVWRFWGQLDPRTQERVAD